MTESYYKAKMVRRFLSYEKKNKTNPFIHLSLDTGFEVTVK